MIRMHDEDFKQARIDLISLVEWSGEIAAAGKGYNLHNACLCHRKKLAKLVRSTGEQSSYADLLMRSSAHHDKRTWKIFLSATWWISTSLNPADSTAFFHSSIDKVVICTPTYSGQVSESTCSR